MRLIAVAIWSLLISVLVSYVLSNMTGTSLELLDILVLGIVFVIAVMIVGNIKVETKSSKN